MVPVTVKCPVFLKLFQQVSPIVEKIRLLEGGKRIILDMYFGPELHEDICEVMEWNEFIENPEKHFSQPLAKKLLKSKDSMLRNVFNVYAGLKEDEGSEFLLDGSELIVMIDDITQEVLPRPLQMNMVDLIRILEVASKHKMLRTISDEDRKGYRFEEFLIILQFVTRVISRKVRKASSVLREMFAEELRKLYQGNEYYKELQQVMEWMLKTAKRKGFAADSGDIS